MATKSALIQSYKQTKSLSETARIFGVSRQRVLQATNKKYQEYNTNYTRKKAQELREKAIEKLGGKCIRCGFSDIRALQIDHVNGGGNKELKAWAYNRRKYYQMVFDNSDGKYQLLCANCNWIKKSENKEIGSRLT